MTAPLATWQERYRRVDAMSRSLLICSLPIPSTINSGNRLAGLCGKNQPKGGLKPPWDACFLNRFANVEPVCNHEFGSY